MITTREDWEIILSIINSLKNTTRLETINTIKEQSLKWENFKTIKHSRVG